MTRGQYKSTLTRMKKDAKNMLRTAISEREPQEGVRHLDVKKDTTRRNMLDAPLDAGHRFQYRSDTVAKLLDLH